MSSNSSGYNFHEPSEFTNALKSKWDSLHDESDVFRYKINKIKEKVVDGKYLLQLNPDRCIKRRTPELIDNIKQPFDNSKFNFTKVSKEEIIFTFKDDNDTHTILVNVSPISRHHSLFCPSVNKGLPQVMTQESLQLALDLLFLAQDRDLRIGFNSLCAFASVNHLHYHLLYEIKTLAIETAELKHVKGNLYKVDDKYTVPAFCFEVQKQCNLSTIKEIHKLIKYFLDNSIAHNILITNKRNNVEYFNDVAKIFIWARKSTSGVKNFTAFNVAVCELSGWFPIFSEEAFDSLKSEDLENELRKWKIDNIDVCDLNK